MATADAAAGPVARLILYVGKGGVGKTTTAAATAVRAAELGHRTLVVSTDIAHSLGDALGVDLAAAPRPVADHLFAQEINVLEEARRTWGKLQGRMGEFLRRQGVPEVQADELAIVPGMEEVAALVQIGRHSRTGEYDCVVVDAAPTGETIRLLSMPDSFLWYVGHLQTLRNRLRFLGPMLRSSLPELDLVEVVERLSASVRELRSLLTNPRRSSYRIVVTPDRMVLKEARRAETYLNLFQYPVDAVVLNRVLAPPPSEDPFLAALLARQAAALTEVRRSFAALPIFEAPLVLEEPVGLAALAALGRRLFGDRDPTQVMHIGPTQAITPNDGGYLVRIPMANVEVGKLALTKHGDELYVEVGNVRREITLPHTLARLEPGVARMRNGTLEIPFLPAPEPAGAETGG